MSSTPRSCTIRRSCCSASAFVAAVIVRWSNETPASAARCARSGWFDTTPANLTGSSLARQRCNRSIRQWSCLDTMMSTFGGRSSRRTFSAAPSTSARGCNAAVTSRAWSKGASNRVRMQNRPLARSLCWALSMMFASSSSSPCDIEATMSGRSGQDMVRMWTGTATSMVR